MSGKPPLKIVEVYQISVRLNTTPACDDDDDDDVANEEHSLRANQLSSLHEFSVRFVESHITFALSKASALD